MNDIDITESSKLMMKQMRQRLRWLIESRDLSQRSISSNVSDSEAYIQNILSGRSNPSLPRFLEVLAYLNVTPQEFFTFELDRPVLMNDLLPLLKQLRDDQLTALIPLLLQWIKDSGSTGAGESISNTKK